MPSLHLSSKAFTLRQPQNTKMARIDAMTSITLTLFPSSLAAAPARPLAPYDVNRPVKQRSATEPRPRWEVLRVLNYLVIALFVCSITYVVFNYRTMSHAETGNGGLFPILVIW